MQDIEVLRFGCSLLAWRPLHSFEVPISPVRTLMGTWAVPCVDPPLYEPFGLGYAGSFEVKLLLPIFELRGAVRLDTRNTPIISIQTGATIGGVGPAAGGRKRHAKIVRVAVPEDETVTQDASR